MPNNLLRQPNFAALVDAGVAPGRARAAAAILDADRGDLARHRRRDAARAVARLARRPGLVRPAPGAHAAARGLRHPLVAPDRCRACRLAVSVRPIHRRRLGRAADARVVAAALAAADDRRHGGDRVAHRRPRGRDGGAAARAGRRAGLSAVHAGPHRPSQRPDRADDADRGRDRVVGPLALGRDRGGPAQRRRDGDRLRIGALSRRAAAPCSRSAMCVDRDNGGRSRLRMAGG